MFKRLLFIGYDFSKHMKKMNISAFAASTAFFLFLSLIPALMLLCACIPYTPLTEANLMSAVTEISPDTMDALLVSIIVDVYDKSIGIVSITAIVTLWSAGKGVLALMCDSTNAERPGFTPSEKTLELFSAAAGSKLLYNPDPAGGFALSAGNGVW